jgi:hypothetical protein
VAVSFTPAPPPFRSSVGASLAAVTESVVVAVAESSVPSLTFQLIVRLVVSGVFEVLL